MTLHFERGDCSFFRKLQAKVYRSSYRSSERDSWISGAQGWAQWGTPKLCKWLEGMLGSVWAIAYKADINQVTAWEILSLVTGAWRLETTGEKLLGAIFLVRRLPCRKVSKRRARRSAKNQQRDDKTCKGHNGHCLRMRQTAVSKVTNKTFCPDHAVRFRPGVVIRVQWVLSLVSERTDRCGQMDHVFCYHPFQSWQHLQLPIAF